jgi:hypothetical protein
MASVYWLLRSSRWSEDQKIKAMFWIGAILSVPFTLSQVVCVFTGRGPVQWLYWPNVAFVNRLPRWRPSDPRGALARETRARVER